MIKNMFESKIYHNYDYIIEEICDYFGEEYAEEIKNRAKKVGIVVVKEAGTVQVEDVSINVDSEPVCIKNDSGAQLIIPADISCDPSGNVVIVHLLLHALGEELFVKNGKEIFNETIVDYMANEISKGLKRRNVDVTAVETPNYESKSFYSNMFNDVEEFFEENKEKIIDRRMGKLVEFENVEDLIEIVQNKAENLLDRNKSNKDIVIKRR